MGEEDWNLNWKTLGGIQREGTQEHLHQSQYNGTLNVRLLGSWGDEGGRVSQTGIFSIFSLISAQPSPDTDLVSLHLPCPVPSPFHVSFIDITPGNGHFYPFTTPVPASGAQHPTPPARCREEETTRTGLK